MAEIPIIAHRLKQARLRAGLSQMGLGVAAGIDELSASPRVNQYERGKHVPDLATAERLAAALDIPAAYLYARDDDLAEAILLFGQLPPRKKQQALGQLANISGSSDSDS